MTYTLYHFRCCVAESSAIRVGSLILGGALTAVWGILEDFAKSKVNELEVPLWVNHQVVRFQVSVDHCMLGVQCIKNVQELCSIVLDPRLAAFLWAEQTSLIDEDLRQTGPLDQLKYETYELIVLEGVAQLHAEILLSH